MDLSEWIQNGLSMAQYVHIAEILKQTLALNAVRGKGFVVDDVQTG